MKGYSVPELDEYLYNPSIKSRDVDIDAHDDIDWCEVLDRMILIRKTEELLGDKYSEGLINTPIHLSIGQEAVSTGVALNLTRRDYAFGNHRSHGHYLAMGGDAFQLICEVLGKQSGCSSGMGGSMHITSREHGFMGSVPIVAGTIPIALGAALFAKKNTENSIGVAFFGDGAVEEGAFHESMNFASTHSLPILFVCENNLFSSHMHLTQRQPFLSVGRFAGAHGIELAVVDGNNVAEVYNSVRHLIHIARNKRRPVFLEAVTYRWRAHVGPTEDMEIGYGRRTDLPLWKKRDPVERLFLTLEERLKMSRDDFDSRKKEMEKKLLRYFERACGEAFPGKNQLFEFVYTEGKTSC